MKVFLFFMLRVTEAHVRSSTAFEVLQWINLRNKVMAFVGHGNTVPWLQHEGDHGRGLPKDRHQSRLQ